jgi:chaperonin GroEL (HSP60 family)
VIFAEKVDGAALGLLVQNNQHGTVKVVAVRAPGFGHRRIAHLHDLAAFTGAQVIAEEAGLTLQTVHGQAVVDQVRTMAPGHGLNALSGDYVDLFADGVIDPLRVTRLTIQHAASVAALMLTTEALVAEELIAQPGAVIAPRVRGPC